MTFEPHPLALLLPEMTPAEFQSLVDSIKAEGQREPIILLDGKILDGRHRFNACVNLGLTPDVENYDTHKHGDSPAQFVLAKNVWRRHLSVSQRAAIATEIIPFFESEAQERMKRGTAPATPPPAEAPTTAAGQAAAAVGVSESSVRAAKAVKDADPAAFAEVQQGKKSVTAAKKEVAAKKPKGGIVENEIQRKAAVLQLTDAHGEEFAQAVLRGDLLAKGKDFEDFMTLDGEDQKKVMQLVKERWTVKKALDFLSAEPKPEDEIRTLFVKLNAQKKKKLSWTIGAFTVSVQAVEG